MSYSINTAAGADALVSAAEVARLAGVTRAAVSNWRRRYADFPAPVGGERNPLFVLAEVRAWLDGQSKGVDVSPEVRVWEALRNVYGDDMVRGLADVATHLIDAATAPLERGIANALAGLITDHSPAEALVDLVARYANSPGRARNDVSSPRLTRAIRHFAGPVTGTVFDPACGVGCLLLAFADSPMVALAGQEVSPHAARLAQAQAVQAGLFEVSIKVGDSLRDDAWANLRADLVICDPPASTLDLGQKEPGTPTRWEFGAPTRADGELAWLQHCFAHVAPGGRAVIALPPSTAHRKAGRRIRVELIRQGVLTQVIALPGGTTSAHSHPVHLWVLTRPAVPGPGVATVRLVDLTANDPDGSLEPRPEQIADVPLIDLLDDDVDLTPSRHLPQASTAAYAELVDALRTSWDSAPVLPSLTISADPERVLVRVADLMRDGQVRLADDRAVSISDQLDDDYLQGFIRAAANTRRATSSSGSFRLDARGSRILQMSIDNQRVYAAAFRAIDEFEQQIETLAALAQRVARTARDGLANGSLQPASPPPALQSEPGSRGIEE